jgi:hypothetical protein
MCFSLPWLEQVLVWLVIVFAIVAILRLVIPWVLSIIGAEGGIIVQILNIALWAFIAIVIIYFAFSIISCLAGGLHLPQIQR